MLGLHDRVLFDVLASDVVSTRITKMTTNSTQKLQRIQLLLDQVSVGWLLDDCGPFDVLLI
jgi:hypothetical protein